jgi:hypothetical protein
MLALEANAAALQSRLPNGWELSPYAGEDLRGTSLRGANMLVPFHEVYAVRSHEGEHAGLPQVSYIAFVSQAREQTTGELAHLHWFTYTEDPAAVPGKYGDGALAEIGRSQTFSKARRGETQVREAFSAVAERGEVHLLLVYDQGGDLLVWASPDKPNLPLRAARDRALVQGGSGDERGAKRSIGCQSRLRARPRREGRAGGCLRRQRARGRGRDPTALHASGVRALTHADDGYFEEGVAAPRRVVCRAVGRQRTMA